MCLSPGWENGATARGGVSGVRADNGRRTRPQAAQYLLGLGVLASLAIPWALQHSLGREQTGEAMPCCPVARSKLQGASRAHRQGCGLRALQQSS